MTFAIDSDPSQREISDALNYLLGNFTAGVISDPNTGQITGPTGTVLGYLYQYMAIKYADSFDGSVNFSNTPTNRQYYGIRNSDDAAESSNPADYIWYKAAGGFGITKSLWYISTGGRQIQFAISVAAPDTGWLVDPGSSIDLDVVTSGNIPVIAETFIAYFTPTILQVPRTGSPLAPVFTGIVPVMYATDKGAVVPFTDAQTDSAVGFVNGSWRIGNSSTTGNGDISYTNITIGSPIDAGDYAQWPNPTAMPNSPAYITVPVRYKNSLGTVSQAGVATLQLVYADPGATGAQGSSLDISGYTSFVQNAGGLFTPASATLSAVLQNVTSPTYSWTISGATPTSSTASSVVVTPTSSSTGVSVSLTVNGSNLATPLTKTMNMPVVYDGAAGTAGANGVMSAFPTIYQWTGSSTPPTRPSTTSTYTWSTGAFTAPSGWSTSAPSNTTAGNYLWTITVPLTVSATTTTSTLDWTNTAYPIRSIAYNGANGANGTNGTNGTNGSAGSATYVITRTANDSSAPTNAEVSALLGRTPVSGDIATVSYNAYNNAVVYQYTTSWVLFQTYITGSLIVQNTITSDKLSVNSLNSITANTGTLTVSGTITANTASVSGSTLSGTGAVIYSSGVFGVGNSTNSLVWDNSTLTIKGDITGSSNINIAGDALFYGQNLSTNSLVIGGLSYYLDYSAYAEALTTPTLNSTRVGFYGRASAAPNVSGGRIGYNVGLVGYGQNFSGSKGVGVVGQGDQTGGYFSGADYGVIALATGTSPIGLWVQSGTFKFGSYEIPVPTGSTTTFLRNDGQWATPAGGGTVTSVSGTGSVSGLTLSGTVTNSGSLTLGGSLSLSAGDLTATAPGSAYYLSGSGWTSTNPVMSLAGTNSGSATVSSNTLNLLGSTSTGIAGAYVGTSGSGNTVTFTVQTTSPSDSRLKEEVEDADVGLDFVKKLRPVSYKLKADPRHQKGYGFIADEVEKLGVYGSSLVYEEPNWQVGDEVGFKTIHYPSYIAVLTKAIQELTSKIETLEAKLKG